MLAAVATPQEEFDALYALGDGTADESVESSPTPSTAREADLRATPDQPPIDWSNVAFALTSSVEARRRAAKR